MRVLYALIAAMVLAAFIYFPLSRLLDATFAHAQSVMLQQIRGAQ